MVSAEAVAVVNFGSAAATTASKIGTAPPGYLYIGQVFFDTDAAAGSNWTGCTAANTWTTLGGAAGALTPGDKQDINVVNTANDWQIDPETVTNLELANMATGTIKGRVGAGTGDPQDLTGAQATTLLDVFSPTLKGLVPLSGGGTTNFLRADGTWAAAGGSGTLTAPATLTPATPAADGPAQLTIRNNAATDRIRLGTLFGDPSQGSIYLGSSTAALTNYALAGTDLTTTLNGLNAVFLATQNNVRLHADAGGITTASQVKFQYGAADVALQRASAGVLEVNNTTAGQHAPLITGFRDASNATPGTGLTIRRQLSAGSVSVGFEPSAAVSGRLNPTPNRDVARLDALWTNAADASRTANLVANVAVNGVMTEGRAAGRRREYKSRR